MTLPSSGIITLNDVRTELGLSGAISLNQSEVRGLAGVSSGAISLGSLYGKSALPILTSGAFVGPSDTTGILGSGTPMTSYPTFAGYQVVASGSPMFGYGEAVGRWGGYNADATVYTESTVDYRYVYIGFFWTNNAVYNALTALAPQGSVSGFQWVDSSTRRVQCATTHSHYTGIVVNGEDLGHPASVTIQAWADGGTDKDGYPLPDIMGTLLCMFLFPATERPNPIVTVGGANTISWYNRELDWANNYVTLL